MTTAANGGAIVPEFTIHDRLKKAREVAGLSRPELADRIYGSESTVSNYENNSYAKDMKEVFLRQWAMATGVSYDWIVGGHEGDRPFPSGPARQQHAAPLRPRRDLNSRPTAYMIMSSDDEMPVAA